MEHPELRWIDTAVGGPARRGRVQDVARWRPPAEGVDVYRSVFRFGDDFRAHVREHRSVRGYRGIGYADYLPIDIDAEGDLGAALAQLRGALARIEARTDADLGAVHVYLSGSKGFHVQIPTAMFGPAPAKDLYRVFGRMVQLLLDDQGYDPSVYDLLRIFRVAGTRHGKTGLYKTPLTFVEARTLTVDEIVELARSPRRIEFTEPESTPDLASLYADARAWADEHAAPEHGPAAEGELSPLAKPCVAAMLRGVSEPGRHDVAMRIAAHWAHQGMPPDQIEAALKAWNTKNRPPMDDRRAAQELPKVAREAARYDFGCNDPVRIRYCGGACHLKAAREKRKAAAAEPEAPELLTAEDAYRRHHAFVHRSQDRVVGLGIPSVDRATRGLAPGEVCEIVARSGVGKTALLVNTARHLSRPPNAAVLFVSLEMATARVFQRMVQIAAKVTAQDVEAAAMSADPDHPGGMFKAAIEQFRNVWIADRDRMRMEELEALVREAPRRIGRPLTAVLIDYLGRMSPSRPGRAYDFTSEQAQRIKSLAKECDVPIIYLHQASRAGGSDGTEPITLTSGRDSGVTEEAADIVIGMWRPRAEESGDTDVLEMCVLKARNGRVIATQVTFMKSYMTMGETGVETGTPGKVVPMRQRETENQDGDTQAPQADPGAAKAGAGGSTLGPLCTGPVSVDTRSQKPRVVVRDARGRVLGVYDDPARARQVADDYNRALERSSGRQREGGKT